MSTYTDEYLAIQAVWNGWTPPTGVVVYGPNEVPEMPDPSSDPAAPAGIVLWDTQYERVELISMDKSVEIRGQLIATPMQQVGTGEALVRALLDSIDTLFIGIAQGGVQFLAPHPQEPVAMGNYYGRPTMVPFARFREPS